MTGPGAGREAATFMTATTWRVAASRVSLTLTVPAHRLARRGNTERAGRDPYPAAGALHGAA
jgi:hypothetical protein